MSIFLKFSYLVTEIEIKTTGEYDADDLPPIEFSPDMNSNDQVVHNHH